MAKILVVDDDPGMRKFVRMTLRSLPHEVIEAGSAMEGLSVAAQEAPDLFIIDYLMPEMDGLEMLQWIRKQDQFREIPVMIMSVAVDRQVMADFINFGMSYYITKPINISLFKEKVQWILEAKETRELTIGRVPRTEKWERDRFRKPVVVVGEPNEMLLEKLTGALSGHYSVVAVTNGFACLKAVLAHQPDAVLIEPEMPLLSGFELAKKIRDNEELENAKILFFTSKRNRYEVERTTGLFDDIIEKPYITSVLVQSLKRSLDRDHYEVTEIPNGLVIKLARGCLKWFTENHNKAMDKMDEILFDMFESGRTSLVIDMRDIGEDEVEYLDPVIEVVDKASEQEISIDIIGDLEESGSERLKKGHENVNITKPALWGS